MTLTCALTTAPAKNGLTLQYSFKPPGADYGDPQDSNQKEMTMKQDQSGAHQCKVSTNDAGVVFSSDESNSLQLTLQPGNVSYQFNFLPTIGICFTNTGTFKQFLYLAHFTVELEAAITTSRDSTDISTVYVLKTDASVTLTCTVNIPGVDASIVSLKWLKPGGKDNITSK